MMRNRLRKFPVGVAEQLAWYVYIYSDPCDDTIVYIGKGQGDRVFSHLDEAEKSDTNSPKVRRIKKIWSKDEDVIIRIFRHGLQESEALLVEAALIDIYPDAANAVTGHHSSEFGDRLVQDIISEKAKKPANIDFPAVIINIRKQWLLIRPDYSKPVDEKQLYNSTRTAWPIQPSRHPTVRHAIAVAFGIIRQVYEIEKWEPADVNSDGSVREKDGRWMFHGRVAKDKEQFIGQSIDHLQKAGARFPIKWEDKC